MFSNGKSDLLQLSSFKKLGLHTHVFDDSSLKRKYLGRFQSVCFYHTAMAHSQMEEALKAKCDLEKGRESKISQNSENTIYTKERRKENHNKGILFLEQEESHTPGLPHSVKNMWKICVLLKPLLATE